ncbi:MAG: hypothetical protein O2816_05180 [Planctomycetota bacterium]|nr:hypothetical protein [Planctomycetota bacterium]
MRHLSALASLVLLCAPAAGQYFSHVLDQQVRPMDLEETAQRAASSCPST